MINIDGLLKSKITVDCYEISHVLQYLEILLISDCMFFCTCVRTVVKADKDDIIEYAIMEIIMTLSKTLISIIIKLTSS